MENNVFICHDENAFYPDCEDYFSPSEKYPEYQYSMISKRPNPVYKMVRDCLIGLQMDNEHKGTSVWNPLGDIIKKGDKVVLKPNMVKHINPSGELDCLITNVSVVRAVLDYVFIALQGTGKVILGDAPVQTCDFQELVHKAGYDKLITFYKENGCPIDIIDFRGTISHELHNGILMQLDNQQGRENSVLVNLGNDSMFYQMDNIENLRITCYSPDNLLSHHNDKKHEYLINRDILEANVIINLPKPKTHRKAGITGALKNMVGVNVEKEYLPHHKKGSKEEGGDEYPHKSIWKSINAVLLDRRERANYEKKYQLAKIYNFLSCIMSVCSKTLDRNEPRIREGSWYGNDTIWRTVNDLNRIVLHCDTSGRMNEQTTRKIFTIADMIIIGEGEGPLAPSSRRKGLILAGINPYDLDFVIATLMGIDVDDIPSIKYAINANKYRLNSDNPSVKSNDRRLEYQNIKEMDFKKFEHVIMPSGWKNV